jgi:hypothetical protein
MHLVWVFYRGIVAQTGFPMMVNPFIGIAIFSIFYSLSMILVAILRGNIPLIKMTIVFFLYFVFIFFVFLKTFFSMFWHLLVIDGGFRGADISVPHYPVFLILSFMIGYLIWAKKRKVPAEKSAGTT